MNRKRRRRNYDRNMAILIAFVSILVAILLVCLFKMAMYTFTDSYYNDEQLITGIEVPVDSETIEMDYLTYDNSTPINIIEVSEPTPIPEDEPRYDYTEYELYLLAKIIYCEAGIESYECKKWVGDVILNRCLRDNEFPNTIEEVIFDGYQFSPTFDGSWETKEPDIQSYEAAYDVLHEPGSITGGALYFEAVPGGSKWHIENLEYIKQIDSTRFYRE